MARFGDWKTRILVGWALAVAVVSTPPGVAAQDVTDRELESFERHVAEASEAIDEGNYEAGIESFEKAREIIDHPRLSVAIADAYRNWGRCSRAESQYRELMAREDLDDEQREKVRSGLADTTRECRQMTRLVVECTPEDASLHIEAGDEEWRRDCPFEGDVPVGDVEIEAKADGFVTDARTVEVGAGEPDRIDIGLNRVGAGEVSWGPIVSWGTIGVGGLLVVAGGISDYGAGDRMRRAAEARDDGDYDRLSRLQSEADAARTRTLVLYGVGGVLVAAGTVAHFAGLESLFESDDEEIDPFSLRVGPRGAYGTWRW